MNAVLSVQGASAPVKKKSFFSKFTRLNMLRPWYALCSRLLF